MDLSDEQQVRAAVAATKGRFGGLDVVVNNAGYGVLAAVEEVTDAEAREMFDLQIFGVWNVLRAVLPGFREQHGGHIINVSSILGLTSFPGWGLYCAGKYALEGLTESLAAEVADQGINVTLTGKRSSATTVRLGIDRAAIAQPARAVAGRCAFPNLPYD